MNAPTTTLPCEVSYCPEPAATLASRVDASRDYIYLCEFHAMGYGGVWEVSTLRPRAADLAGLPPPQLSLELTLSMWPPKHRTTARKAARAILASLEAAR